jgi:hypothetical protein
VLPSDSVKRILLFVAFALEQSINAGNFHIMSRVWTILPQFRGERAIFERKRSSIYLMFCVLLLASCGESTPRGYQAGKDSDTLTAIVKPPDADSAPALPGTTGSQKTADGLPVLSPRGANTKLFAVSIDDEKKRIERLENAVQELRNDFDAVAPAIVRLVAIEKDIQNLVSQLEVLTGNTPAPTNIQPIEEAALDTPVPEQPAAIPAPPAPNQPPKTDSPPSETAQPATPAQEPADNAASALPAAEAEEGPESATGPPEEPAAAIPPAPAAVASSAPAPSAAGQTAVTAMRVGKHPDKTRIVLDVNGKTDFTAELDNAEKVLLVELPGASWSAPAEQVFDDPVISSCRTEKADAGTRLICALKKETALVYKGAIEGETGGSRIVIDLKTK